MRGSVRLLVAALACACIGAAGETRAADGTDAPRWEWSFTPYLWAQSLKGDVTVGGIQADVDVPFRDIFKMLNFGLMGALEARRGRFFVLFDGMGALLSDELSAGPVRVGFGPATFQQTRPVGPRGGGSATVTVQIPRVETLVGPAKVDVDQTMVIAALAAGYSVVSRPMADLLGGERADDPRRLVVDLYGGARMWYLKTELDLFIPPVTIPGFTIATSLALRGPFRGRTIDLGGIQVPGLTTAGIDEDFDATAIWVDPLVGVRVRADLTDRFGVALLGNVGGFGIGSASDLTWEALAAVGWRLNERWTLRAGYRALGVERGSGSKEANLVFHGPIVGATRRFRP